MDGFYQSSGGGLFDIGNISRMLGNARFQFIEMDSEWVYNKMKWGSFPLRHIKGEGRYTRFYLADRGDPNCESYEEYINISSRRAKKVAQHRANGIYPKHCIAAINTDELKSEYGLSLSIEPDPDIPEVIWNIDEIKNMKTGERYASYSEFQHCYKGKKKNGYCRGNKRYSCPVRSANSVDGSRVIYYQTFKATPNSILEKELVSEEIREPVTVPVQTVTPELIEVLEGEENIKKLKFDEVLDLYMSIDAEGYAWFQSRSDKYERDGEKYHSQQEQIFIINEEKRRLLKVDISIESPRKQVWYDYCCIRAIPKNGVYFTAIPILVEQLKTEAIAATS